MVTDKSNPQSGVTDKEASLAGGSAARDSRKDWFALSNFLMAIVSAIAGVASLLSATFFEENFPNFVFQVHWLIFVTALGVLYVLSSYLVSKFEIGGAAIGLIFRIPSWVELRNFGDQRVARVSYFALAAIPFVAYFLVDNPLGLGWLVDYKLPLNMKISFFIAFFFSLALIIFIIGCPKEFHRKKPFEGARNVNIVLTSVTKTNIAMEEADEFYNEAFDFSKIEIRALAWMFYALGLSYSVILLLRVAYFVVYA